MRKCEVIFARALSSGSSVAPLCTAGSGTNNEIKRKMEIDKTVVVRGHPEDIAKLKALYRMLNPDLELEFVEKPLRWARGLIEEPEETKRSPFASDLDRRVGEDRRRGKDRRKVVYLTVSVNRRAGADRRNGKDRRAHLA